MDLKYVTTWISLIVIALTCHDIGDSWKIIVACSASLLLLGHMAYMSLEGSRTFLSLTLVPLLVCLHLTYHSSWLLVVSAIYSIFHFLISAKSASFLSLAVINFLFYGDYMLAFYCLWAMFLVKAYVRESRSLTRKQMSWASVVRVLTGALIYGIALIPVNLIHINEPPEDYTALNIIIRIAAITGSLLASDEK